MMKSTDLNMLPALDALLAAGSVTVIAAFIAWILFASAIRSLRAARDSLDDGVRTLADSAADVMEKF